VPFLSNNADVGKLVDDSFETHEEWGMRQFNLTREQVRQPDVYAFIKNMRYSMLYGMSFPEVE